MVLLADTPSLPVGESRRESTYLQLAPSSRASGDPGSVNATPDFSVAVVPRNL